MSNNTNKVNHKDLGWDKLKEPLFDGLDRFNGGVEATVGVWLGGNRHLILVENVDGVFYDATSDSLERGPGRMRRFYDWFLAGRAAQVHADILQCTKKTDTF